ncbi:prolyl oligopeptidase family serine peptidase [Streptomyces sp. SudanB182_2057]|uniref:carboxylesterase family protein n=1 Tax=Streptomyces sp. SudanB182_2057 TaxID=3035281 RepID=UPI003F567654
MATHMSRRTILAAGAGAGVLSLPGVSAYAAGRAPADVRFTLNAEVLNGGEQVTSITLETARLGPIDPAALTAGTFGVHAKATRPFAVSPADTRLEYDLDRTVTAVRLDGHGNIVIELAHGEGWPGASTLGYVSSVGTGRNVVLDLDYTVTQRAPIVLRNHRSVTIDTFVQNPRLSDPEVDAFSSHISGSGMKYRLYSPESRYARGSKRPLIVWLHGGGEGAALPYGYYDNETTLRANRGALGFTTPEAQDIFDGAYVVAPQSTSYWMEDGPRFAPLIHETVHEVARRKDIDYERIYVAGCSNGGYMSMKMTAVYPDLFAASVPICGIVGVLPPVTTPMIPDSELAKITTPSWLVASKDDPIINAQANTVHAHEVIPGSLMTLYDHVIWNDHQYLGHFSWIYIARNDPCSNGTHIWQWMAARERD